MGGERLAAPGKTTAVQVASASVDRDMSPPVPGKTTLPQGGMSDASVGGMSRSGMFLSSTDRGHLEIKYAGRVNDAHAAYLSALGQLRLNEMVKKEEEFPLWATVLLAAGGKAAESLVMGACALLKGAGGAVHELAAAGVHGVEARKVTERIMGLSEKTVESLIGIGVDAAKDKVKGVATTALGAEEGTKKQQALSFISYMEDQSMALFQNFREQPLDTATDAQLLALFTAFSGTRHTPSLYVANAKAALEQYMNSHAKDVGHRDEQRIEHGRATDVRVETRVAWITDGKNPPRKGYVRTEYKGGGPGVPGDAYNAPENALGLSEPGTWHHHDSAAPIGERDKDVTSHADQGETTFLGYVEPEMADVADQAQEQRWLQGSPTYQIHYPSMQVTEGYPRLQLGKGSK